MKQKLAILSVLVASSLMVGCAKTETTDTHLQQNQQIVIGNDMPSLGTITLNYSNTKYLDGYQTIIVNFDKLPFEATFNNCALEKANHCKSKIYLSKFNDHVVMDGKLVYLLNNRTAQVNKEKVDLPVTKRITSRWTLNWGETESSPVRTVYSSDKGVTITEELSLALKKSQVRADSLASGVKVESDK